MNLTIKQLNDSLSSTYMSEHAEKEHTMGFVFVVAVAFVVFLPFLLLHGYFQKAGHYVLIKPMQAITSFAYREDPRRK
jgi:hypothetical protein